jgi:hypothetical protein
METRRSVTGRRAAPLVTLSAALLAVSASVPLLAAGGQSAPFPALAGREAASASRKGADVWLDASGEPLPFDSVERLLDFLRTAAIEGATATPGGVSGARKVLLVAGDLRVHAVFRDVDVTKPAPPPEIRVGAMLGFRDSAMFEAAAYELSRLLHLDRVPPTVARTFQGRLGTVQIWMEDCVTENDRERKGLHPPDPERWYAQMEIMNVWDGLIGNVDRNGGNMLIDRNWKLWFIDHTRAFINSTALVNERRLTACDRDLWRALTELDDGEVRARLEAYLTRSEIRFLLQRKKRLVKHFQALIRTKGERAVLYSVRGAEREPAP